MITPSFNLTATERVLPKLALDFTTASLDSRVTFTRADATATRVNSSGYVETVAADTPRFDYDPITLVCKGLLVEESRTNLLAYSEVFTGSPWSIQNASLEINDPLNPNVNFTSPNSNLSAVKLVANTVASAHVIRSTGVPVTNATTYTYSFYAKKGEYSTVALAVSSGAAVNTVVVNLNTGVVTSGTATIQNAGNGWWRIAAPYVTNSTLLSNNIYVINGTSFGNRNDAGDGTSGIYVWGAQLEAGAFATSYIPTTTTALTRNADVATMTGYGSTSQGTFTAEATYVSGKTLLTSGSVSFAATASTSQKTAVGYNATSIRRSIGAAAVTSTAGATAGTDITFGTGGTFKKMALYLNKMIDAELQAFSK